jgi:hypothetical protein
MYGSQGWYIYPRIDKGSVNILFGGLAPALRRAFIEVVKIFLCANFVEVPVKICFGAFLFIDKFYDF